MLIMLTRFLFMGLRSTASYVMLVELVSKRNLSEAGFQGTPITLTDVTFPMYM